MKKKPPSYSPHTRVLPTATPQEREHVAAFIAAMRTYSQNYLASVQQIRLKDRPAWVQSQILQHRQWLKLCNMMDAMNRQRRATPESLDDLTQWPITNGVG